MRVQRLIGGSGSPGTEHGRSARLSGYPASRAASTPHIAAREHMDFDVYIDSWIISDGNYDHSTRAKSENLHWNSMHRMD
jgi:hypothetical protein